MTVRVGTAKMWELREKPMPREQQISELCDPRKRFAIFRKPTIMELLIINEE